MFFDEHLVSTCSAEVQPPGLEKDFPTPHILCHSPFLSFSGRAVSSTTGCAVLEREEKRIEKTAGYREAAVGYETAARPARAQVRVAETS